MKKKKQKEPSLPTGIRIYLASRYGRKAELKKHRKELIAMGHQCTSNWLDEEDESFDSVTDERRTEIASQDWKDVNESDLLVVFTTSSPSKGGGHHFEAGLATGWARNVIVVGPRVHVFYYLPWMIHVEDWESAKEAIRGFQEKIILGG